MRNYSFPLTASVILLLAYSTQAAEKPRPAQGNHDQTKKVWTNDDMDQLRSRGLISIVGQEATQPAAQAPAPSTTSAETTFPIYQSRVDDPQWYADTAADLQARLDKRRADLQQQQAALARAKDRVTQPGLSLEQDNAGVTPAAGVENLQAQVQEVQSELDELSDLARQHNIAPGVLRG